MERKFYQTEISHMKLKWVICVYVSSPSVKNLRWKPRKESVLEVLQEDYEFLHTKIFLGYVFSPSLHVKALVEEVKPNSFPGVTSKSNLEDSKKTFFVQLLF